MVVTWWIVTFLRCDNATGIILIRNADVKAKVRAEVVMYFFM